MREFPSTAIESTVVARPGWTVIVTGPWFSALETCDVSSWTLASAKPRSHNSSRSSIRVESSETRSSGSPLRSRTTAATVRAGSSGFPCTTATESTVVGSFSEMSKRTFTPPRARSVFDVTVASRKPRFQ